MRRSRNLHSKANGNGSCGIRKVACRLVEESRWRPSYFGCSAQLWRSLPGGASFLSASGRRVRGVLTPHSPTRRNKEWTRMSLPRTGRQECLLHQAATNTIYTVILSEPTPPHLDIQNPASTVT